MTARGPHTGRTAATGIAEAALTTGRGDAELVLAKGLLPAERPRAPLRSGTVARRGARRPSEPRGVRSVRAAQW